MAEFIAFINSLINTDFSDIDFSDTANSVFQHLPDSFLSVTLGEVLLLMMTFFILSSIAKKHKTTALSNRTIAEKIDSLNERIESIEIRNQNVIKDGLVSIARVVEGVKTAALQKNAGDEIEIGGNIGNMEQTVKDGLISISKVADGIKKEIASLQNTGGEGGGLEAHCNTLAERVISFSEERLNRMETRIENISELIKERARTGDKNVGDDIQDKIEQQSIYLHDEFVALAEKINAAVRGVPQTATTGETTPPPPADIDRDAKILETLSKSLKLLGEEINAKIDAAMRDIPQTAADDSPAPHFAEMNDGAKTLETLSRAVKLLGEEINAKLSLLHNKLEQNEELLRDIPDIPAIQEQVKAIADTGAEVRGETSFAQLIRREQPNRETGRQYLSTVLPQILPFSYFTLNAKLPNGQSADALVQFPEPDGAVVIDAGFSPPQLSAEDAAAADDEFKKSLAAHIDHIADNIVSAPYTSENALLFISSESLFAEIHARLRDTVRHAQRRKVWLVSPAVLPAVLSTINAAVRDHNSRRQLHELRAKANLLAEEARHFENRIADIGDHVHSAWRSVQRAENTSGRLADDIRGMSDPAAKTSPRIPDNNESA